MPWAAIDSETLQRAKAGDSQALGRFFDHYVDRIYAVARRFVGSGHEAQDLTQEIFLRLRRHLGQLDLDRDPAPWLFTVTINVCRDHLRTPAWRHAKSSVSLNGDIDQLGLLDEQADPQHVFAAAEERRRVREAILKLPPDQFMSVILHDFEGLPHERIAGIAGIEHVAARKRHSRALRALERLLGGGAEQ